MSFIEDLSGNYNEKTVGLKFNLRNNIQMEYSIKKRDLPEDWTDFRAYDIDEDYIGSIAFEIPF